MAIFDKAKEKFQGFMQGGDQANRNRRSNGGTSGYRPVRTAGAQPQPQEVPAGAFGGGVMPDTMFGAGNFERVAATGAQPVQHPNASAPQQTAKRRSFRDMIDRALGKQENPQPQQQEQPQQSGNVPYGTGTYFTGANAQANQPNPGQAFGGNAMNGQASYNNAQYGTGRHFTNPPFNPNAQYNNAQYGTSQRFNPVNTGFGAQAGQPMGQNPYASVQRPTFGGQQTGYHAPQGQPVAGNPMNGQPVTGQPVAGQPVTGTPVHGQTTGYSAPYGANAPYQQTVNQTTQQNAGPQAVNNGNVRYFPGSFLDEDGNTYRAILNVVQVTSVSSCYRLIEFLQNNEILLVNAEDISDRMEARRCLDILYGACVVSKCSLTRVSKDTLYIITPADVKLSAFDGIRRMGEQDIQMNWPYPETQRNGGFTSSFGGFQGSYRDFGDYPNAR